MEIKNLGGRWPTPNREKAKEKKKNGVALSYQFSEIVITHNKNV